MKEGTVSQWQGRGLITAGAIVLFVGLSVALFREFGIPRYWIPVTVGIGLIGAGVVSRQVR